MQFDVLAGSVEFNSSAGYLYDGVSVRRIACKIFGTAGYGESEKKASFISRLKLKADYIAESVKVFFYLLGERGKYSLFHIFGNNNVTSAAVTFAKIFNIPAVLEVTMDTQSLYQREIFPVSFLWTGLPPRAHLVAISQRLKKECLRMGYPEEKIWCRPNPVDETRFFIDREKRDSWRSRLSRFSPADILLVNISKFIPRKNQIFLVEVLRHLPERYKLFLAGPFVGQGPLSLRDREYMDSILLRIRELRLEQRIEIKTGFVEDVSGYIKMADVFLFPTRHEGLGTPMLESLACGIPVVANKIEGVTDSWIKEGSNGYLSILDPGVFAEKAEQAVLIPREKLDVSSEEILRHYSTASIDREYADLLEKMGCAIKKPDKGD